MTVLTRSGGAARTLRGARTVSPPRAAYVLSAALCAVAAVAGAWTLLAGDLLTGPAVTNGSARGTALVIALVAVALLPLSMLMARQSVRALAAWLGAAAYLIYNSLILLFGTPFNRAFLLYVATLGLAVWSVIAVMGTVDHAAIRDRFSGAPTRAVASYLWLIAGLNALLWLRSIVPALVAERPMSLLDGSGMTTNPVYVEDLAFWLPLAILAAWGLWGRRAWSYLVAGSMLVFWVVEAVGVAVDQFVGHRADPASTFASTAAVWLFAALAVVGVIPLFAFLKGAGRHD